MIKTGTKSLLFGVHQFIIHPITVYAAWIWLYKARPDWKETICIIIHDWGYWGKEKMDDENGERHPEAAAKIARILFGSEYYNLCLYHSRHYARNVGVEPSRLCWADKASVIFETWWTYLPRAWASGELTEYRRLAVDILPPGSSHKDWFFWLQEKLKTIGIKKRGDAIPYINPARGK